MKLQTSNTSSYFLKRASLNVKLSHMYLYLHLGILSNSPFGPLLICVLVFCVKIV